VTIDTVGSVGNTDTMLAVYDTWACPRGALLACNDDIDPASTPPNTLSRVIVPVTVGQTIKIRVSSFGTGPEGTGFLNITNQDNDLCEGAQSIAIGGSVDGSLANATQDFVIDCDFVFPGQGKWHTVVGNGNTLTASTCDSPGQAWQADLSVYCGGNCNDLTCVAANSTPCGLHQSVSWCSTAGQTYWILVHSAAGPTDGNYTLTVDDGRPCGTAVACGCFQCPVGAAAEGEVCATDGYVDATNGGCNSTPPVFGTIVANGSAVCGTGSIYFNDGAGLRDTDWYTFTIAGPDPVNVQMEVSTTFVAQVSLVQNTALDITQCVDAAIVPNSTLTTSGDACTIATELTPSVTLQPGTYAVFVAPTPGSNALCSANEQNNRYWVRLIQN
jgi:hypothetical protein